MLVVSEHDTIAVDTLHAMNMAKEERRARSVLAPSGRAVGDEIYVAAIRGDSASQEELLEFLSESALATPRFGLRVVHEMDDFSFAERLERNALDPVHPPSTRASGHISLARLYVTRGRWSEALAELRYAHQLDPDRAILEEAVLASLPWLDLSREAESLREELRDHPDDLEARFLLAQVLMRQNPARGRPALEAKEHFEYVLGRDPDFVCPI